jgi:hypothetical protein
MVPVVIRLAPCFFRTQRSSPIPSRGRTHAGQVLLSGRLVRPPALPPVLEAAPPVLDLSLGLCQLFIIIYTYTYIYKYPSFHALFLVPISDKFAAKLRA